MVVRLFDQWTNHSFFLKSAGTILSDKEQLTSLVIEGKRMSKHSLTKKEAMEPTDKILLVIS